MKGKFSKTQILAANTNLYINKSLVINQSWVENCETKLEYILEKAILVVYSGSRGYKLPMIFNPTGLGKIFLHSILSQRPFKC